MSTIRTSRRRRRDAARPLAVLVTGLLTLSFVAVFVVFNVRAPRNVPLLGYKTVYATLPETGNLRVHAEVRSKGVRIGEVVSVKPAGNRARARLKLDPGVLDKLPADTTASVRGKGLLGARFIELEPGGSPRTLPENGTMRAGTNPITPAVTDALDLFDTQTRGGLGTAVGELGRGLLGRGKELNAAVDVAARSGRDFNAAVDAVLARRGAARRLAPSLDSAMAAFANVTDEFGDALAPGERALRPFVDRREAVRRLLREAPPTLQAATTGLDTGRRLLDALRSLASAANRTLPAAPRGLRQATALLRQSDVPLRRADVLLRDLRPSVPAVLEITDGLRPVLRPLQRLLDSSLPIVDILADHGCDIVDFGDNWRSTLNQGTKGGSLIGPLTAFRVTVLGAPESVSGVGRPPVFVDRDGYPSPCKFSRPQPVYNVYDATGAPAGVRGGRR